MDHEYYYNLAAHKKSWEKGDLKNALDFIDQFAEGRKQLTMLEVGCGDGETTSHLPNNVEYIGLDASADAIGAAKSKYPDRQWSVGLAEKLPFEDRSFDVVFLHQVLEHVSNPKQAMLEFMRVVKPSGVVMIIAPNIESPFAELHAIRHYSTAGKMWFSFNRWTDLVRRLFGSFPFRMVPVNYTEATGRYERSDDDLKYVTSAFEVASFFRKHGFEESYSKRELYRATGIKNLIKHLLVLIPSLRYYGSGMYFIFKKV